MVRLTSPAPATCEKYEIYTYVNTEQLYNARIGQREMSAVLP